MYAMLAVVNSIMRIRQKMRRPTGFFIADTRRHGSSTPALGTDRHEIKQEIKRQLSDIREFRCDEDGNGVVRGTADDEES